MQFYFMSLSFFVPQKCVSFFGVNFNQIHWPWLIHNFINTKTRRSNTTADWRVPLLLLLLLSTKQKCTKESMHYNFLATAAKWKPQRKWINYNNGWDEYASILWGIPYRNQSDYEIDNILQKMIANTQWLNYHEINWVRVCVGSNLRTNWLVIQWPFSRDVARTNGIERFVWKGRETKGEWPIKTANNNIGFRVLSFYFHFFLSHLLLERMTKFQTNPKLYRKTTCSLLFSLAVRWMKIKSYPSHKLHKPTSYMHSEME